MAEGGQPQEEEGLRQQTANCAALAIDGTGLGGSPLVEGVQSEGLALTIAVAGGQAWMAGDKAAAAVVTAEAQGAEWTIVAHRGRAAKLPARQHPAAGVAATRRAEVPATSAAAELPSSSAAAVAAAPHEVVATAEATGAVSSERSLRGEGGELGGEGGEGCEGGELGGEGGELGGPMWARFLARHPKAEALNLQLRHVLGEGFGELSMAQLGALLQVQRLLQQRLEEARLLLARRLEREAVEARLALEIEKRLQQA